MHEILSVSDCYNADELAVLHGVQSIQLMEQAGAEIARVIASRFPKQLVVVLCGPGNNGGDGFVVARHLRERGWDVLVASMVDVSQFSGDAAVMARRYDGPVSVLDVSVLDGRTLVVDALFGAGLSKPISGGLLSIFQCIEDKGLSVASVDVPSGVHGDTGVVMGGALQVDLTVTFFRKKLGHVLMPGREYCGETVVVDIGIPDVVLDDIEVTFWKNTPVLWKDVLPVASLAGHKYDRGHALVVGGPMESTGAARLAARAALRLGAGLVTVTCDSASLPVYASGLEAVMTKVSDDLKSFEYLLTDKRKNAVLFGPGLGVCAYTRERVLAALKARKSVVLDADALTVFAEDPDELFTAIDGPCILTPHEGEFTRLFLDVCGSKVERARAAAVLSGAVVVLKGADTVIAHPDGRTFINTNAPPWLATAGSGDVLAGMCVALLAQGMEALYAAGAAVWLHGAAGNRLGIGCVSEDIPNTLPALLSALVK